LNYFLACLPFPEVAAAATTTTTYHLESQKEFKNIFHTNFSGQPPPAF